MVGSGRKKLTEFVSQGAQKSQAPGTEVMGPFLGPGTDIILYYNKRKTGCIKIVFRQFVILFIIFSMTNLK